MISIDSVTPYTDNGIIVHPLTAPVQGDKNTGKAPIAGSWQSRTTPYDIKYLERELSKGCNIGANCGKASDLTVIDIDYHIAGVWDYIFDGVDTSNFVTQIRTEKDGKKHYLFKYCSTLKTCTNQELGFDIRNDGGNIVLAPSVHYEGDIYKISGPIETRPELPSVVAERITEVISLYKGLKAVFAKCRPCFYKLWKAVFVDEHSDIYHDTTIFRQAEGRQRHLYLFAELKANGATPQQLMLACWLIFGECFNEVESSKGIHGIDARKTPKNITLQADEYFSRFVTATHDAFSEGVSEEISEDIKEISLEEIKAIKMDLNNRRIPDLSEILPKDHFINKVTSWMSGLSDTYYEYQVSSALWLLSALTCGKCMVALKQNKVYPNLYMILLGQSTTSRKSTAVRKIKPVFEAATDTDLYNDDPTIEGYLEMLVKNPVQNFVRDEASGLLAKYHKKYNEGIFDLECSVYDGDSVRKIKAAGKDKEPKEYIIKNPYVTHLYATTPDKFSSVMTTEDFKTGYGYRLLYAFPTYEKPRMDFDLEDTENVEAWADVMASTRKLYHMFRDSPQFKFSMNRDAIKLFNDIGIALENAGDDLSCDHVNSAIGRAQDNILKLAMLLEIGKSTPSKEITAESLSIAALLVIDFYLPSFMQIMDRILSDEKTNKIEKAIAVIRGMNGTCTRSTLIKNGHFTKKECDEVVEAMVIGGILLEKKVKETGALTYILTTESKSLDINSNELSKMFSELRTLRKFRKFHSFARDEKNPAKSAKNQTYMCGEGFKDVYDICEPCEICESCEITGSKVVPEEEAFNILDQEGL